MVCYAGDGDGQSVGDKGLGSIPRGLRHAVGVNSFDLRDDRVYDGIRHDHWRRFSATLGQG